VRRLLVGLLALLSLSACTTSVGGRAVAEGGSDPGLAAAVGSLPQRSVGTAPAMRLAEGLAPPTNRWFSGLVFPPEPQPVFPLPLSVALKPTGLTLGVPAVRATDKTIFGSHTPALDVPIDATELQVVAYDDLTVTVAFLDGTAERGRVLLTRGSPFLRYTAAAEQTLTVGPQPLAEDGTVEIRGDRYGVVTDGTLRGSAVTLPAGASATFYAVPPGGDAAELAEAAKVAVTGGDVVERVDGDTVRTTLTYRTEGGDTLVAAMPDSGATSCASAGEFATLYGPMELCRTSSLELSTPVVTPSGALDVGGLSGSERGELEQAVAADTAALELTATDTYFGGKQLALAANLLTLAEGLDMAPTAQRIRDRLVPLLERWTEPNGCAERATQCFVYDPVLRGMVGLENSFGSEEFNDHQFHYGYFLYAAAILGKDDPALVEKVGPVIDLLAADIGNPRQTAEFPRQRAFDAFEGHSWASGFSPFGDGNNQESSSESVTAYNGLALWAAVRGDAAQRDQAVAMLSREAASAVRYWTQPTLPAGFGAEMVSINWGGKRDYATWFSAEPSAMLGIQLIPMSPVAEYLRGDPDRIRSSIAEAAPAGYDVPFGDYLLMYLALADRDEALQQARDLPDTRIDDGNTRSYMLAWIMTRP